MCRSQISGRTKDQFAGENEVCEISQTHKKGCEITSQQKADFAALRSWLSACDVRLPPCRIYRETSGGIDSTHGSLALKAYQQNLYLEYYY